MKTFSLFVLLIFSACSTVKLAPWSPFPSQNKSGFLLLTSLTDQGYLRKGESCVLYLKTKSKFRPSIPVTPGLQKHLMQIPDGVYRFHTLSCNMVNEYSLDGLPEFSVQEGKVSYIGQLTFALAPNGDLDWKVGFYNAPAFAQNYEDLPPQAQSRLISGYGGQEITKEMVASTREKTQTRVSVFSSNNKTKLKPQQKIYSLNEFDQCFEQEKRRNLVKVGKLEYILDFNNRKLTDFKQIGTNTLSEELYSCLEPRLKSTKVLIEERLSLQIQF